ncbi:MAG: phosphodiesterase [Lysobacterales bacterium]|jgi:predicted signal transduction protein with EAL and GGDEF domain|nr:MAG: phosphodiesterase [Xanthomonadales bacterium]
MRPRTLASRFALLSVLLLCFALAASALIVRSRLREAADAHAQAELARGALLITSLLEQRGERLVLAARTLAADYGLREVMALGDAASILEALRNHGARIGADRAWWLPRSGEPIPSPAPFAPKSLDEPSKVLYTLIEGRPHQVILVELRAPARLGYLALAYALDETTAERLSALSGLTVRFTAADGEGTSAAHERLLPLGDGGLHALLTADLESLSSAFRAAERQILLLALIPLIAAAFAAYRLSLRITRPLEELAAAADRIARGEFEPIALPDAPTEVHALAERMASMGRSLAEREARLAELAYSDPATALPSRAGFIARLNARSAGEPLAVLLCEMPPLREIAATFGAAAADRAIAASASRLKSALGREATLARVGEQMLALGFASASEDEALAVAFALLAALREPMPLDPAPVWLEAQIGIALAPAHGRDPETLLRRAEAALTLASAWPERCAIYQPGLEERRLRAISVLGALPSALTDGGLELHYQPQVRLADGRVAGVEALLRWQDPRLGSISPSEFVPLAEKAGLSQALTRHVLSLALAEARRWRAEGVAIELALNLSALDLLDQSLPAQLRTLLAEHAIEPERVTLEITESAAMRDPERSGRVFARLKNLGVKLAIDDFGSGYSSLAQLRQWPVDELKLDASHVRALSAGGPRAEAILAASLELGRRLGLRTVAEGVEDAAALAPLKRLGCDRVQGWLVAPAMPAAAFRHWWRERTGRWPLPAA